VSRLATALAAALVLLSATPAAAKGKPLEPGEKVDVNAAPVEELMRLPGIGRKRAEAIAALRARRPFRRADEIAQVKGISPAWVAKNRGVIEVSAPAAAAPATPVQRAAARPPG
jgi:competence protein ComEA